MSWIIQEPLLSSLFVWGGETAGPARRKIIIQMLQLEDRIYPLLTFFAPCCSTEIIEMPPALAYFWFETHCLAECADQCSSDRSLVLGDETGTKGLWIIVQVLIDTLKTTQQLDRCQEAFFFCYLSERQSLRWQPISWLAYVEDISNAPDLAN